MSQQDPQKLRDDTIKSQTLDGLILVKENKLRELEAKLEDIDSAITDNELILEGLQLEIDKAKEHFENEKLRQKGQLDEAAKRIWEAKEELGKIDAEIAERKDYSEQQELHVGQAIANANEKLLQLKDNIGNLTEQKDNLALEVVQERSNLDSIQHEALLVTANLDAESNQLEDELTDLTNQVVHEQTELKQLSKRLEKTAETVDHKMMILKTKEAELMTKMDVIAKERQELDIEKRRWNSTDRLYS